MRIRAACTHTCDLGVPLSKDPSNYKRRVYVRGFPSLATADWTRRLWMLRSYPRVADPSEVSSVRVGYEALARRGTRM